RSTRRSITTRTPDADVGPLWYPTGTEGLAMLDPTDKVPVFFKDVTSSGLCESLAALGVSPRLARRLQAAVLQRRAGEVPAQLPETPKRVLEAVRSQTRVPRLELLEKLVSAADGFAKYLFRGEGFEPFEAVRIPLLHRPGDEKYIVCV